MKRIHKGNSLIEYIDNFCSVDIETTGLRPETDHIIEIGAARYRNGRPVKKFQALIRPPKDKYGRYVSPYIAGFTHISNTMLDNAKSVEYVLPKFKEFLGSDIIVGYNVNFDVNFLYDNFIRVLREPLKNDFIDVLRLSRKYLPQLDHHTLTDTITHFGIVNDHAHRAFHDSYVTGQAYMKFCEMSKITS